MRVNLGSGTHPAEGWLNVDVDPSYPGVDVVADATALPFHDGAVAQLFVSHVCEHLPLRTLADVLLHEWRRVLAPAGVLMIVGPDIDRAVQQNEPHWLLEQIIAHGDPPAGHAWTCSERVLAEILGVTGWRAEPVPVQTVCLPEWPNPEPSALWQLALRCSR